MFAYSCSCRCGVHASPALPGGGPRTFRHPCRRSSVRLRIPLHLRHVQPLVAKPAHFLASIRSRVISRGLSRPWHLPPLAPPPRLPAPAPVLLSVDHVLGGGAVCTVDQLQLLPCLLQPWRRWRRRERHGGAGDGAGDGGGGSSGGSCGGGSRRSGGGCADVCRGRGWSQQAAAGVAAWGAAAEAAKAAARAVAVASSICHEPACMVGCAGCLGMK
jgi:hypothetical protein